MASAAVSVVAGVAGTAAGSAVAGVAGTIGSAITGAVTGAVVGGVVSAAGATITGGDPGDAFVSGAVTGAIGGGLAGWSGAASGAEGAVVESETGGTVAGGDLGSGTVASDGLGADVVGGGDYGMDIAAASGNSGISGGTVAGGNLGTVNPNAAEMNARSNSLLADQTTIGSGQGGPGDVTKQSSLADQFSQNADEFKTDFTIQGDATKKQTIPDSSGNATNLQRTPSPGTQNNSGILSVLEDPWNTVKDTYNGMGDFEKMGAWQVGGNVISGIGKERAAEEERSWEEEQAANRRRRAGNLVGEDLPRLPQIRSFQSKYS